MYSVIFLSRRSDDASGYDQMAQAMVELGRQQPGFIRIESFSNPDGLHCTISWWDSEEAIAAWKANAKHAIAQKIGQERWYDWFETQVAEVKRVHTSDDSA